MIFLGVFFASQNCCFPRIFRFVLNFCDYSLFCVSILDWAPLLLFIMRPPIHLSKTNYTMGLFVWIWFKAMELAHLLYHLWISSNGKLKIFEHMESVVDSELVELTHPRPMIWKMHVHQRQQSLSTYSLCHIQLHHQLWLGCLHTGVFSGNFKLVHM